MNSDPGYDRYVESFRQFANRPVNSAPQAAPGLFARLQAQGESAFTNMTRQETLDCLPLSRFQVLSFLKILITRE